MSRRLVVTGPESTGKSTLAQQLADHLHAPIVLEAARAYAERAGHALTLDDVAPIARLAIHMDDAAHVGNPPIVVLDTDLISTVVYSRHYYGECAPWIVGAAAERRGDLYLLCDIDLPWISDGVRDSPDSRASLLRQFVDALREFECRSELISGTGLARLGAAIARVELFQTNQGSRPG